MELVSKKDGKIYKVLEKNLWTFNLPGGGGRLQYYTYKMENTGEYFYESLDEKYNVALKGVFIWENFYSIKESRKIKLEKLQCQTKN